MKRLRKIIIITTEQLPPILCETLTNMNYSYAQEGDINNVTWDNFDAFVIDSSHPGIHLQKSREGVIPTGKTSFYFKLDALRSDDKNKYLGLFINNLHRDISINYKEFEFFGETNLHTEYGEFQYFGFRSRISGQEVFGVRTKAVPKVPLIRNHSMCYTGDIFHSLKCNCREEFENSIRLINEQGGILLYSPEAGRGFGALNKIQIYQHQESGADTVEAQHLESFPNDLRTYHYLKDIFAHFEITNIRLITSNPEKVMACYDAGTVVSEVVKIPSTLNKHNRGYLKTKMEKNHHNFQEEFYQVGTNNG